MSDQTPREPRVLIDTRAALVLAIALVIAVGLFALNRVGDQWARGADPADTASSGGLEFKAVPPDAPEATAAMEHHAKRTLAETQITRFKSDVTAVRAQVEITLEALGDFEDKCRDLLSGEGGRRLAAHDDLAREAQGIIDIYYRDNLRPSRISEQSFLTQLDTLERTADEALATASSIWTPEDLVEELDSIRKSTQQGHHAYRSASRALGDVLARAERRGGESDDTLESTLARLGGEQAREHAERLRQTKEEGLAAVMENRQRHEERLMKLAAIASNREAREILWFLTEQGRFWEPFLGAMYYDYEDFDKWVVSSVNQANGHGYVYNHWNSTETSVQRLNQRVRATFDMSLHDLFRVFISSEANRDEFVIPLDETRAVARGEIEGRSEKTRQRAAEWLQEGSALPKATLP